MPHIVLQSPINLDEFTDTPSEDVLDGKAELYYWIELVENENIKELIYKVLKGETLRAAADTVIKTNNLKLTRKSFQSKYYRQLSWIKDRLQGKPEIYYKYRLTNLTTLNVTNHLNLKTVANEIGMGRQQCYTYINWSTDTINIKDFKLTRI